MLQIAEKIIIVWCIVILHAFAAAAQEYAQSLEWNLEDALEEEFVDIDFSHIVTPDDLKTAIDYYKKGEFRQAALILEKYHNLNLPHKENVFFSFAAAECCRQLHMKEKAQNLYRYIVHHYPESDKTPPAYFRLLQYAYDERNNACADSIITVFETQYRLHPLYNSALYVVGKLYFQLGYFGEAITMLLKVAKNSSRYFQAQFCAALSYVQLQKNDDAITILKAIQTDARNEEIRAEASALIADIYFSRKDYENAQENYQRVSKDIPRYNYASLKLARLYLFRKEYERAREIAKTFVEKGRRSEYFFEMASILEEVYEAQGEKIKAAKVKGLVSEQNINARLTFEITEEMKHIYDIIRRWKNVKYSGLLKADKSIVESAESNIASGEKLIKKCKTILYEIGALSEKEITEEIPGLAFQRYMALLRKEIATTNDSLQNLTSHINTLLEHSRGAVNDSLLNAATSTIQKRIDSISTYMHSLNDEYASLKDAASKTVTSVDRFGREIEAKYIDWAFMRYGERKNALAEHLKIISSVRKNNQDSRTRPDNSVQDSALTVLLRKKEYLQQAIVDDRNRLIEQIAVYLDANPASRYIPQILFRLAELYYDRSSEDFGRRLEAYEQQARIENDSISIAFPEYNLDKTISLYDQIIRQYPDDWIADDVYFYKALALQKLGREDKANGVLETLTKEYSESEYFVEANMNIGGYYFAHPQLHNNTGYKRAEEAYRRVLYYRNHPQFVPAVYHLGWCYYMQDMYDDAIAVFKYLVEETHLEFDLSKSSEKQIVNPLMREEAIDYIAISFDQQGEIEEAIRFLNLIGNQDYAAKVFKRIGELREEDLDYQNAIVIYQRLVDEYALSSIAPHAALSMIKVLETVHRSGDAMNEREKFFQHYAKGSQWYETMIRRDSSLAPVIDSMAIAIGLYVADTYYRKAEENDSRELFQRAVDNYSKIITAYPAHPYAYEAQWNRAVILDKRLYQNQEAYDAYRTYSSLEQVSTEQREQAALNAIAIAQRIMDEDNSVSTATISKAAEKVVEAAQHYLQTFPEGSHYSDVVMNIGSLYFNKKIFPQARSAYSLLLDRGPLFPQYYHAAFLTAMCYFGEEKWTEAADFFERVWRASDDQSQKQEAYKYLLQSHFLLAKQLFDSGNYPAAAAAFETIHINYPGSEYGDIALFNAAAAYEKNNETILACKAYQDLFDNYPQSQLAPDALFDAALNYEKIEQFENAAAMYERIIDRYPQSPKAKDALFNSALAYEKLGDFEKMAAANERYSQLYPGEKDVEILLFRSAQYYYKTKVFEKAKSVYRNYIARYSEKPRTVEAYYMIGKCFYQSGDETNALMSFEQAEAQHRRLLNENRKGNAYFAAEAAYETGLLKQKNFSAVTLSDQQDMAKKMQHVKTDELTKAVNAFQRVIKYKSQRIFEMYFRIGILYEELARSWVDQKLQGTDAIKAAIAKKEQYLAAVTLLQKSFSSFILSIELAAKLDSVTTEQYKWIDTAKVNLTQDFLLAGTYLKTSIREMQKAPVPYDIKLQPLYYYQYLKQLLETLEPLKMQARVYYHESYEKLKTLEISEDAENECLDEFGKIAFLIPYEYDKLGLDILKGANLLPKNLSESEREELIFQFEDMVFELQDKALFMYEDALNLLVEENMTTTIWHNRIIEQLARLDPQKYGKNFYKTVIVSSDEEWIYHTDSVKYWNAADPFALGWNQVEVISCDNNASFVRGNPCIIWGDSSYSRIFLWKNVFLDGIPREATIYIASSGKYTFYLNERLITSDTSTTQSINHIDSITGVASYFKGGDNIIGIDIIDSGTTRSFSAVVYALVDSTTHFKSKAVMPDVEIVKRQIAVTQNDKQADSLNTIHDNIQQQQLESIGKTEFRSVEEIADAIVKYKKAEKAAQAAIKKERIEIQKLYIKIKALDELLNKIKKKDENLKKNMNDEAEG